MLANYANILHFNDMRYLDHRRTILEKLSYSTSLFLLGCGSPVHAQSTKIPHPDEPRAGIEYFIERPEGSGPWPTVVFLHGHQNGSRRVGGRAFVDWGVLKRFAQLGYLSVSISLPGFGGSQGNEDFAGPFTQKAVTAVIEKLKTDGQASRQKILIQGISLGAVTAALVAADDQTLAGLVLISGLYDLPAFFRQPKSAAAASIKAVATAQTGGSEEALRARSALFVASRIRASTLIMNGGDDDRTDPDQATRFSEAINAGSGKASVHIFPGVGHEIPISLRDNEITAFIAATLRA